MRLRRLFCFPFHSRKINLERCALAWLAVDKDGASALLHNSVYRRESEAGPLSNSLGCKKRFEDLRFCGFVHATTRVAYRQNHILSGTGTRMLGNVMLVQFSMRRLNDDLASAWHRIPRIHHQVHQD